VVTEREFADLVRRVSDLEQSQAGIQAQYALLKFALPLLISTAALVFTVYRSAP
jgi:hypothetical protein